AGKTISEPNAEQTAKSAPLDAASKVPQPSDGSAGNSISSLSRLLENQKNSPPDSHELGHLIEKDGAKLESGAVKAETVAQKNDTAAAKSEPAAQRQEAVPGRAENSPARTENTSQRPEAGIMAPNSTRVLRESGTQVSFKESSSSAGSNNREVVSTSREQSASNHFINIKDAAAPAISQVTKAAFESPNTQFLPRTSIAALPFSLQAASSSNQKPDTVFSLRDNSGLVGRSDAIKSSFVRNESIANIFNNKIEQQSTALSNQAILKADLSNRGSTLPASREIVSTIPTSFTTALKAELHNQTDASLKNAFTTGRIEAQAPLAQTNINGNSPFTRDFGVLKEHSASKDLSLTKQIETALSSRILPGNTQRSDSLNSGSVRNVQQSSISSQPAGRQNDVLVRNPDGSLRNLDTSPANRTLNIAAQSAVRAGLESAVRAQSKGMRSVESRYLTGVEIGILIAAAGIARVRANEKTGKAEIAASAESKNSTDILIGRSLAEKSLKGQEFIASFANGARRFPAREITLSAVIAMSASGKMRDPEQNSAARVNDNAVKIERVLGEIPKEKPEFVVPDLQFAKEQEYPEESNSDTENKLLGLLPAAPAFLRKGRRKEETEPDLEDELAEENKSDPSSNKSKAVIISRETYQIVVGESLVSIAENKFHDAGIAYLIVDLNPSKIIEHEIDGRRVVEIRSGQKLDLPNSEEIRDFYLKRDSKATEPDNLVTIVLENQLHKEHIEEHLKGLLGQARRS
ncbi:MAG: hypothetical protein K2X27_21790, partial [Candidatus Obscuribacterales bacterium]|nr:hypothetical protein [Candidatus Obscuribacterales bacterium]